MNNKNNFKKWGILNKEDLPKDNMGRIDYKKCNGKILKCKYTITNILYEIKIVDYIKGYKTNDKKEIKPKFKVNYIFLKDTEYEEKIENIIQCSHLINGNIGNLIPSLNQWIKKDNYWIGIDTKGREFKFSTNNKKTEYNILHSTWKINPSNNYVMTGNLNNDNENWQMHRAVYFDCNKEESDKNIHKCVDHINNDKTDNRIENLRLTTRAENSKNKNTNNKYGLVGLIQTKSGGWYSQFKSNRNYIYTKVKYNLEEAKIDNLIAQKHLKLNHNEDQFYKLEKLSEERIEEVINLIDKKTNNNKNKIKEVKEYFYDYIEKDNLIGIKTFKKNKEANKICWVDKDFGRIKEDKFIIEGDVYRGGKDYFFIDNKRINVYIMVGEMSLQNYRNNNFHVDHINQKTNENYRDNLEIVTIQSNMMNKKGKGYCEYKIKKGSRYRVSYANEWKYFDLYIEGIKNPTFNTKEEAIHEVKRRREIVDKYRFRVKTLEELDEVIDFAEEHDLDVDSAYIVWKGLDTEDNIKNSLK